MVSIEGDGQPLLRWAMMPIRCTNYSAKSCAARVQGSLARTAWRSTPSYTVSNALCRFFATVYIGTSGYLPSSILLAQRPGARFAAFNIFLRRNFQSLSTLYLRPMPCIQHVCGFCTVRTTWKHGTIPMRKFVFMSGYQEVLAFTRASLIMRTNLQHGVHPDEKLRDQRCDHEQPHRGLRHLRLPVSVRREDR